MIVGKVNWHTIVQLRTSLIQHIRTLLIAAIAGMISLYLGLPLPFLLGPMIVSILIGKFASMELAIPVRNIALLVLGMQIGSGLTPEGLSRLGDFPLLWVIFVCCTAVMIIFGYGIYRQFGWSHKDAFLASIPGALSVVLALATDRKANTERVMLAQTFRLVMLAMLFPLIFPAPDIQIETQHWSIPVLLMMITISVLSGWILQIFSIPAAWILGPCLITAIFSATGVISGSPHPYLIILAFMMIGTSLGARFVSGLASWRESLMAAILSLSAMLIISVLAGWVIYNLNDIPLLTLALGLSPGGIEAMVALAVAFQQDVALVSAMHIVRILGLTLILPILAKWVLPESPKLEMQVQKRQA